jgi:hypothetical protein
VKASSLLLVAMVMGLGTAVQADSNCSGCTVQQPDQPSIPHTPEDQGCSNCAITVPVPQKLGGDCSSCAIEQPGDEVGRPAPVGRQKTRNGNADAARA